MEQRTSSLAGNPSGVAGAMLAPNQLAEFSSGSSNDPLAASGELLCSRLGVAASLFTALRCRHSATASHSLRVTLTAAAWSLHLGLSPEQLDVIEVAALFHDLGKLGLPDSILLKPSALTPEELQLVRRYRIRAVEILKSCCQSPAVLEIVAAEPAWYDGYFPGLPLAGEQIPLGARMLAIADAFDAMTSALPYRRPMSTEQALAELQRNAGTQFDPQLVSKFAAFVRQDASKLHLEVVRRWMDSAQRNSSIGQPFAAGPSAPDELQALYHHKLVDNMRDAAIFIDPQLCVVSWNPGAERMTGIAAAEIVGKPFVPGLFDMRNESGSIVLDDESPVEEVLRLGEQRLRRLIIRGRGGADLNVEAHIIPVSSADGNTLGAAVLMHDVSPELSLEARCQSLHEMATRDPLTKVANRAEFNRVHEMFVVAHLERKRPCCLIITDIDHFKSVNDTYGHQAGDEVLKSYARLLRASCRSGDLVARYGGEEFVLLCADTDGNVAAARAEAIRKNLSQLPHPTLGARCVTASFGATEIEFADTPAVMLARADRALYQAKDSGRNCVIVLGKGLSAAATDGKLAAFDPNSPRVAQQDLVSPVPLSIVVEKLRGFVGEHRADIVSVDQGVTRLKMGHGGFFRRRADRSVPILIDLTFKEIAKDGTDAAESDMRFAGGTKIRVEITLQKARDRRRQDAADYARNILASLRSYLMASEDSVGEQS